MNKSIKTLFRKKDLLKYQSCTLTHLKSLNANHRLLIIYLKNKFKLNKQFQLKNKYFPSKKIENSQVLSLEDGE